MASLTEVYGNVGEVATERQVTLGVTIFLVGSLLAIVALVVGTTQVLSSYGIGTFGARRIAGTVGGLAVPAVFVGIFMVLPASQRIRAAAAIGASIAVLGVALFWWAYPSHWAGYGRDLTLQVLGIYFLGTCTTFWCLFTAVANFKIRNDPGGTVTLQRLIMRQDPSTPSSESRRGDSGLGSVGLFGRPTSGSSGASDAVVTKGGGSRAAASDGGATEESLSSPLDEDDATIMEPERPPVTEPVDRYCGNCAQFQYARTGGGIKPYCGHTREVMDDMTACEHWEPNRTD